jgi:phosphoserine phosphatase
VIKHLSVFDLDNTLLSGNGSFHFCLHLIRARKLSFWAFFYSIYAFILHQMGFLTLQELHGVIFNRFLVGSSLLDLQKEAKLFVAGLSERFFYRPALQCLERAKSLGHVTMILSSSPEFLVEPIAHFLGVNQWKGSSYAIDKEKKLCNIFSIIDGDKKASYLLEALKKLKLCSKHSTAYSDSFLDCSFLKSAGYAVAVKPDRQLRKVAKQNQWQVI